MIFAPYIPLLGSALNLLLALFVLMRDPRSRTNRVYFFLGMAITSWNFGQFRLLAVVNYDGALFWARFVWMAVIFGPALLFHLSLLLAGVRVRHLIWLVYGVIGCFAVLDWTPLFIKGVRDLGSSGWYAIAGPALFAFHPIFTTLVVVSIYILVRKRKRLPPLHKTRLNILILAQGLLLLSGLNDVMPIFGIDYYPGTGKAVFPYGSVLAAFYGLLVGYSVLQHDLLSIQVSFSRYAAQGVRFVFLFTIGLVLLLTATLFAPGHFTPISLAVSLAVLVISGVIASLLFPRMFGSGLELLESRILGDRFEYHDRVQSFIVSMQWLSDSDLLLADLDTLLVQTVGVDRYQLILADPTRRGFSLFRSRPEQVATDYPELNTESPVFRYFKQSGAEYLALGPIPPGTRLRSLEHEARVQMEPFRADFAFPFYFDEEPFGLMLLGPKRSGDPYTSTDIKLLGSLAKTLSLMMNQIRLKNQVLQAQELDLLGRMSRGMAHDLKNLLTPVHTFLQLASEGTSLESLEVLLPVALRNVATMRAYIREALFFSENLRPDFQLGRLDVLLQRASDLVRERAARHRVRVELRPLEEVRIEMDSVMVERLITNVVANAIDASHPDSTVVIELICLTRTELNRDWYRVRIIDFGEGIPKENISRIFAPYFTTKRTGDESRGFGLGLAICRKIAHLHSGTLNINSQIGRGTTVQVDLPSRQSKPHNPVAQGHS